MRGMIDVAGRRSNKAAGFTLVELLIVSVLMMAVTLITGEVWRFLSSDTADLAARVRLANELRLAVRSIAEDMGPAVAAAPVVDDDGVLICKDGGRYPNGLADWGEPDTVVQYYLSDGRLFRLDQSSGAEIVIAGDVFSFTAENLTDSLMRMVIQVRRGDLSRQITLMWSRP